MNNIPKLATPRTLGMLSGLLLSLSATYTNACTTVFSTEDTTARVVARSMDLFTDDSPLLVSNPRGTSHQGEAGENSLNWKTKYGNVVVTEFHSNAASDGLNEKGLAVHLLYLTDTKYPSAEENQQTISNTMWAQYILDNFATVDEALKGTENLQLIATKVFNQTWPIHLNMEDASGDSAIIEFIAGKKKVYHGAQYQVMTNEPAYNIQLSNLKRYKSFGGKLEQLPGDTDPLSRFVRVSTFLKTLPKATSELDAIAGVLSVIRTAMVPFGAVNTANNKTVDAWTTRWITLADVTNKVYYFNSTKTPNIIWIDLNKVNFSEGEKSLSINPLDIQLNGEVTQKLVTPVTDKL